MTNFATCSLVSSALFLRSVSRYLFTFSLACSSMLSASVLAQESRAISIDIGHAEFTALEWSEPNNSGDAIIALPWSGGTAVGYRYLGPLFAEAGYRLIALNPRGFEGSTGSLENLSLHDYANDVAAVARKLELQRVHMLGSALGNRVARAVATGHPDLVATVSLIAAGGKVRPLLSLANAGRLFGDPNLSREDQLAFARESLFAATTSDELIHEFIDNLTFARQASAARSGANRATPVEQWWAGGAAPMLIVQGLDDKVAPPQNGALMKDEFGDRIEVVNLNDAGHLMGLERPAEVSAAIISFLQNHPL